MPEYLLRIIGQIVEILLGRLNVPGEEAVYTAVVRNEEYAGCSREEVERYYESVV